MFCRILQNSLRASIKMSDVLKLPVFKELQNYKRKLFLCPPQKKDENTANILKLLFFIINLRFVTSNQLSADRKLNLPLTSSVYVFFFPLEMQKRLKQTKDTMHFPTLSEKKRPTIL